MSVWSKIVEFFLAFEHTYMRNAFFSAVIIGIVCSIIGVFVLLRGMVFLGQAIAHSAFAGAALAILIGFDPILSIMGFSVLSALGIGFVNQKQIMKDEVIIGIVFSFFMALAVLFIGLHGNYSSDINSILFGNILLVNYTDFILLAVYSVAVLLLFFLLKKELYFMTFDSDLAQISGIPVKLLSYVFLIAVSLTISVSLKAIGAILVFAMIVTPAAAAYQWTYKINRMILLSAIFGVTSSVFGLFFSFLLNIPSGATIVTLVTLIFLISFLFSPKRRSMKKAIHECPFCKDYITEDGHCGSQKCTFDDIPHKHDHDKVDIRKDDLPDKELTVHDHEDHDHLESEEEQ